MSTSTAFNEIINLYMNGNWILWNLEVSQYFFGTEKKLFKKSDTTHKHIKHVNVVLYKF